MLKVLGYQFKGSIFKNIFEEFNILEMWESEYPSKLFIVAVKWTTQPIDGLEYFPLSQHSCNLVESFPLPIYQRRSNLFPFLSPHLSENFREDVFILRRWNWLDDTIVHSWKVCWSLQRNHLAIGILYFVFLSLQRNHLAIVRQKTHLC